MTRWPLLTLVSLVFSLLFCDIAQGDENDLVWSSFLGGSGDEYDSGIAVDSSGYIYVTGLTQSPDFPATVGAFDTNYNDGYSDIFVAKINPTGTALHYATFLGGSGGDHVFGVALDRSSNAYVAGWTSSSDFPTTSGAFDTTYNDEWDVFVTRLNHAGDTLDFSTFLGGQNNDAAASVAVDNFGSVYVTGRTRSDDFPTTAGTFDTTLNGTEDAFVVKFNSAGSLLAYACFLGGSEDDKGWGISVDTMGNAYVIGETSSSDFPTSTGAFDTTYNGGSGDAFVARINTPGSALDYATYLGGEDYDFGQAIWIDNCGKAYMIGTTHSDDFPITTGAFDTTLSGPSDIFVAQLSVTGSELHGTTYLGGGSADVGIDITVDNTGNLYITGETASTDFPTTAGAFDWTYHGVWDAFVAKLNLAGNTLSYSTFLGGDDYEGGRAIALDGSGNVYVTGETYSSNFPITAGAFDTTLNGYSDVFVTTLYFASTPVCSESRMPRFPEAYILRQNHPNPFNSSTQIRYRIPENGDVTLNIYNILGQQVKTLMDSNQPAGEHITDWDGKDWRSREVASGLYFCRLQVKDFTKTIKMMLVK